jgi:hypothetical protein
MFRRFKKKLLPPMNCSALPSGGSLSLNRFFPKEHSHPQYMDSVESKHPKELEHDKMRISNILELCRSEAPKISFQDFTSKETCTTYLRTISQDKHPNFFVSARSFSTRPPTISQSKNKSSEFEGNLSQNSQNSKEERPGKLIKETDDKSEPTDAFPLNPDTYDELTEHRGFIDKTIFILEFHYQLPKVTCFLRPRRSGKSMALQMLKSFYQVPKMDLNAYYSNDSKHPDLKNTNKNLPKSEVDSNFSEVSKHSYSAMALKKLNRFLFRPKIEMEAYYPDNQHPADHNLDAHVSEVLKYFELKNSAEDAFKETKVSKPDDRAKFFKDIEKAEDPDFVKNNMGKWPVIFLDFKNLTFRQQTPTPQVVLKATIEKVIKPAFDQYDYLLLLMMSQHA